MTDAIQAVTITVALSMVGYGLWIINPAAMFIGVGGLLLSSVVAIRILNTPKRSR